MLVGRVSVRVKVKKRGAIADDVAIRKDKEAKLCYVCSSIASAGMPAISLVLLRCRVRVRKLKMNCVNICLAGSGMYLVKAFTTSILLQHLTYHLQNLYRAMQPLVRHLARSNADSAPGIAKYKFVLTLQLNIDQRTRNERPP